MKLKVRIYLCLLALVLVFQTPSPVFAAKTKSQTKASLKMAKLKKKVDNYIKKSCPKGPAGQDSKKVWSVYVKDLKTNTHFTINSNSFFSCSTIKLYAMAAAYSQEKSGKLKITPALEKQIRSMISVSSNEAFNSLVYHRLGQNAVNKFCKANGYKHTGQYTPCGNGGSAAATGSSKANITSAADCGRLLEQIYRKKLVSKSASKKMLKHLKAQTIKTKIPRGVPSGIKIAGKTGESGNMENDVAIVYGKKSTYIICVFSTTNNAAQARRCIAEISRIVYKGLN